MVENGLRFIEIQQLSDDLLLPWLDLFETAFPAVERVLVSSLLEIVRALVPNNAEGDHLVAATDETGAFAGLMAYQIRQDARLALLCYLAVAPSLRNRGLGSVMYGEMLSRARQARSQLLLFEVERPDHADTNDGRATAERRIEFYRRKGARLLEGIQYEQVVGWHQPPLPMYLMAHPLEPMDDLSVFRSAHSILGPQIVQTGSLRLG